VRPRPQAHRGRTTAIAGTSPWGELRRRFAGTTTPACYPFGEACGLAGRETERTGCMPACKAPSRLCATNEKPTLKMAPKPLKGRLSTLPGHRQRSGSDDSEQWEVVNEEPPIYDLCEHKWRMVRLRSQTGQLSAGLQCTRCGDVERVTDRQLRSHGSVSYRASQ
jgi:hypothetical protein